MKKILNNILRKEEHENIEENLRKLTKLTYRPFLLYCKNCLQKTIQDIIAIN